MPQSLGDRLRAARERAGLSQDDAADRLQIKQPQLSKWERDVNAPGAKALERLAVAYGVSVGDLMPQSTSAMDATSADGASSPLTERDRGYVDGRLDAALEQLGTVEHLLAAVGATAHSVGDSLLAIRRTLNAATSGVAVVRDSGALGDAGARSALLRKVAERAQTGSGLDAEAPHPANGTDGAQGAGGG